MKKFIFFLLLFISHPFFLKAQDNVPFKEETRFVYKRDWSLGGTIHNRGFGALFRYSIIPGNFNKISFEAELLRMKHPKEVKIINPYFDDAKSYVYGKKNVFNVLRLGLGTQFLIFDKAPKDGIEISATFMGGLSLGLLKPVYLEILILENNIPDIITEKYDEQRHFPGNIYGYSGFNKGLNEMSTLPGGYLKSGLVFDWSTKDASISALEAGMVFDFYPKRVPIMAEFNTISNKALFISLYASISFGKKY